MTIRTRHRADNGHFEWLATLKRVTLAIDIHNGALGADVLARHTKTHAPVFLEFKDGAKKKLTEKEEAFAAMFPGHWFRCNSVDEALAAVGVGVDR